jgi:alcohol dehydrogenase
MSMSLPLADRALELVLRDRVRFGVGAIASLGELVEEFGEQAFVVTDAGVMAAGVLTHVVAGLDRRGIPHAEFTEVEPNPGATVVERGAAALRAFGLDGTVVVGVGGGSAMDTAKAVSLLAANEGGPWDLGYDDPALTPGRPVIAVVTTAGTGAETNSFGVITDEAARRKSYIGHPSLLPVATILDPALTVGLPPAATAATGIDAMTHSIESLLSANPNPFAEAMALAVIRTVGEWLPRAVADGSDLEARSRMLMASHLAGMGQASGTGVGLVHALGHALGTRGRLPHGTALAVVLPEVLQSYADAPGLRDRGDRPGPPPVHPGRAAADPPPTRFRRRDARPRGRGRDRRRRDQQRAADPDPRGGARDPGLGRRLAARRPAVRPRAGVSPVRAAA